MITTTAIASSNVKARRDLRTPTRASCASDEAGREAEADAANDAEGRGEAGRLGRGERVGDTEATLALQRSGRDTPQRTTGKKGGRRGANLATRQRGPEPPPVA
jgi:hypothetical protein